MTYLSALLGLFQPHLGVISAIILEPFLSLFHKLIIGQCVVLIVAVDQVANQVPHRAVLGDLSGLRQDQYLTPVCPQGLII